VFTNDNEILLADQIMKVSKLYYGITGEEIKKCAFILVSKYVVIFIWVALSDYFSGMTPKFEAQRVTPNRPNTWKVAEHEYWINVFRVHLGKVLKNIN
jgi:hypothetical protein